MCPACIASAAVVTASITSGGGVLALAIARFRKISGSWKSHLYKTKEKQS